MRAARCVTEKLPKPHLNVMTGHQRILHGIDQGVDGELRVVLGQVDKACCQIVDEVGAVHAGVVAG